MNLSSFGLKKIYQKIDFPYIRPNYGLMELKIFHWSSISNTYFRLGLVCYTVNPASLSVNYKLNWTCFSRFQFKHDLKRSLCWIQNRWYSDINKLLGCRNSTALSIAVATDPRYWSLHYYTDVSIPSVWIDKSYLITLFHPSKSLRTSWSSKIAKLQKVLLFPLLFWKTDYSCSCSLSKISVPILWLYNQPLIWWMLIISCVSYI